MESISSLIELQNYLENQIHHSTILDLSKVLKIYLNDIVEKYNRDFGSKWTIDEILQNSICDEVCKESYSHEENKIRTNLLEKQIIALSINIANEEKTNIVAQNLFGVGKSVIIFEMARAFAKPHPENKNKKYAIIITNCIYQAETLSKDFGHGYNIQVINEAPKECKPISIFDYDTACSILSSTWFESENIDIGFFFYDIGGEFEENILQMEKSFESIDTYKMNFKLFHILKYASYIFAFTSNESLSEFLIEASENEENKPIIDINLKEIIGIKEIECLANKEIEMCSDFPEGMQVIIKKVVELVKNQCDIQPCIIMNYMNNKSLFNDEEIKYFESQGIRVENIEKWMIHNQELNRIIAQQQSEQGNNNTVLIVNSSASRCYNIRHKILPYVIYIGIPPSYNDFIEFEYRITRELNKTCQGQMIILKEEINEKYHNCKNIQEMSDILQNESNEKHINMINYLSLIESLHNKEFTLNFEESNTIKEIFIFEEEKPLEEVRNELKEILSTKSSYLSEDFKELVIEIMKAIKFKFLKDKPDTEIETEIIQEKCNED